MPYFPEWGSREFCEQRLRELLAFCKDARIDAVQFYVNIRTGTYYMPPSSAEEQRHWAQWMKDMVAPAVREVGISYQVNFQMLLGASPWHLDMRDRYEWEFLINQHGEETLGAACPIGPVFREKMGEMLRLWASTEPDVFWIDDDFRLHNHGLGDRGPDYYCYCDNHLGRFADDTGMSYSRDELVESILMPGTPGLVREAWLEFLGRTMAETAYWMRSEVQGVSPKIRLALMTSLPDVHSSEGRDWERLLKALCGEHTPVTRPTCGIYAGTKSPVKDHVESFRTFAHSIAVLEEKLGAGGVEYGPELENTRFTTWSKSAANTEYVLMLAQLLGCPQITLSINDLDGSPLEEEPSNLPMLEYIKPCLGMLAEMSLGQWELQGVNFVLDPQSARKVHLSPGAQMADLAGGRPFESLLLQSGIPGRYVSPSKAASGSGVTLLDGYTAWCPTDEELLGVLSGGVLMDAGAAGVLQERGFGGYLGVEVGEHRDYGVQSELYIEGVLPGMPGRRVPHRGTNWHEMHTRNSICTSVFIDSADGRHTGSTVYENSLGGRVAVYAHIGDFRYGTFGSHARIRWLHGILRWLSRERFPVLAEIPHHGLTLLRNSSSEILLAFTNLGTDPLSRVSFRLPLGSSPAKFRMLDRSGEWRDMDIESMLSDIPGVYRLSVACSLNVFNWLVLRIETA